MKKKKLMQSSVTILAVVLMLIMIIISPHTTSARKLATKRGQPNPKLNNSINTPTNKDSSFNVMIGVEECIDEEEEEECLKRRVLVAEAHLDYIYTQHHLP